MQEISEDHAIGQATALQAPPARAATQPVPHTGPDGGSAAEQVVAGARELADRHPWLMVGAAAGVGALLGAGPLMMVRGGGLALAGGWLGRGIRRAASRAAMNYALQSFMTRGGQPR